MGQSYDELEWYLLRLRYARREGKLVFVLGAGINAGYGLPDWTELIVRLTKGCGKLRGQKLESAEAKQYLDAVVADPLLQAAAIRGAYANRADWLRALRSAMPIPEDVVSDKSKPLGRIAKIAYEQYEKDPRRHIAILTFNYDNLMELALNAEILDAKADPRIVQRVTSETELANARNRPGIYVYHLHGALENESGDVVLDAYTYVQILAAPANHWSWSCMNTFLFREQGGAMFVGLSLLDPNLRLLLTQAARNGMQLSAVYVGKPLHPPRDVARTESAEDGSTGVSHSGNTAPRDPDPHRLKALSIAWMMHDVQRLFDNLLEELSLIPYHVTSWSEVGELLDRVAE